METTPRPLSSPPQSPPAERAPAGFVTRLLAMSVDLTVVVVAILAAGSVTQIVSLLFPRWPGLIDVLRVVVGAVISVIPAAYFIVSIAVTGRTVGKGLMGIRVVARDGGRLSVPRAVVRTFAYIVSLLPAGAGFWAILIDSERRGWHDHIAGSRVLHDPRTQGG
jgi:uncharacterized RDD family membrane protein YckC